MNAVYRNQKTCRKSLLLSNNWYAYVHNDPVNLRDSWGLQCLTGSDQQDALNSNVTFVVYREQDSRRSYLQMDARGQDSIVFKNKETGESFTLKGTQTVISYFENGEPKYSEGDTLKAFQGTVTLQYLGNNKDSGQALYGERTSKFYGPVFNVVDAYTENGKKTDSTGRTSSLEDPYRLHSNYNVNKNVVTPLASAGCPMYDYSQADDFAEFLEKAGVQPGEKIQGMIKEDIPL